MYIFVLQSLRQNDLKTGELIHSFLTQKNIPHEFYNFCSKQELFKLLDSIQAKSETMQIVPYIHLDCHGGEDGVEASNDSNQVESILWDEILDKSISIYRAYNKRLVLCMSSCKGFNASKMVVKGKPCPYDYICGSMRDIGFEDSFLAYGLFYGAINNGYSIADSTLLLQNDPELTDMQFLAMSAENLFEMAYSGYKNDQINVEFLEERKQEVLNMYLAAGLTPTQTQLDYLDKAFSEGGQLEIISNRRKVFFS